MCSVGVYSSTECSGAATGRPNALTRRERAASISVATGFFSHGASATLSASSAVDHEVPGSTISTVLGTYVLVPFTPGMYAASLVLPILFSGGASGYLVVVIFYFDCAGAHLSVAHLSFPSLQMVLFNSADFASTLVSGALFGQSSDIFFGFGVRPVSSLGGSQHASAYASEMSELFLQSAAGVCYNSGSFVPGVALSAYSKGALVPQVVGVSSLQPVVNIVHALMQPRKRKTTVDRIESFIQWHGDNVPSLIGIMGADSPYIPCKESSEMAKSVVSK